MVRARKSSAHGGSRTASPGAAYTNRTDLKPAAQPARAASGQEYGAKKQQIDAQRAIPLPQAPPVVPLGAPSQRPNEPLTAGLPIGPGPGPEVLTPMAPADDTRAIIAAWYVEDPSPELADMLAQLDARGR